MPKQKDNEITIRLGPSDESLKKQIRRIAKKNNMTLQALMVEIIKWFLAKHKEGVVFTKEIK